MVTTARAVLEYNRFEVRVFHYYRIWIRTIFTELSDAHRPAAHFCKSEMCHIRSTNLLLCAEDMQQRSILLAKRGVSCHGDS